ncbi:hypothetical protein I4U23_016979 [Adineta vaga]|nr:hypothetical protein I4U23_016979 [Adineta vaga]
MNELSPKFDVEPSGYTSNFTFAELSERNISSGDLYSWFAPIDLIERYQFYLNNLAISSNEIKEEIFYNCTEKRFGLMCQYYLNRKFYYGDDITFYVTNFYTVRLFSETLTCYIFIQCDLHPWKVCLDWTDVCNGKVDCLNGSFDEEYCSEVDINDPVYERIETMYTDDRDYGILPSLLVEDAKCHNLVLTSSCVRGRQDRLFEATLSINDGSISSNCSSTFICILSMVDEYLSSTCNDFCRISDCIDWIEDVCPDMFYISVIPILFNNIYFAYEKTDVVELIVDIENFPEPYICYNNSLYDDYFAGNSMVLFNGKKCYRGNIPPSSDRRRSVNIEYIQSIYNIFKQYNSRPTIKSSESNLIYPIIDCSNDNEIPSIDDLYPHDGEYMYYLCKNDTNSRQPKKHPILFQSICNRHTELLPKLIHGRNETDETECDVWPCNNLYTRCNGFWNCVNGEDEFHCVKSLISNCSSNEYQCISIYTQRLICLSNNKIDDGQIDCLNAVDERNVCNK